MANKKGGGVYTAIFMVVLMIVSFLALLSGEGEDGMRLFVAAVGGFTFLFLFARIGPDVKDEKRKFMQCPRCGAQLAAGARFCPRCGIMLM